MPHVTQIAQVCGLRSVVVCFLRKRAAFRLSLLSFVVAFVGAFVVDALDRGDEAPLILDGAHRRALVGTCLADCPLVVLADDLRRRLFFCDGAARRFVDRLSLASDRCARSRLSQKIVPRRLRLCEHR